MASGDNRALTDPKFWDARWDSTDRNTSFADCRWVTRNYQYAALDRALRSALPRGEHLTFMELGCGQARWMVYFYHVFGYRVFGCDYSPVGCELARQTLAAAHVPGEVEEANFFRLEGRYDIVMSAGVVEHFDNGGDVVAAFARLLRPGGFLITDVPNLGGLNGMLHRLLKPDTFDSHRVVRFDDLRAWHRAAGLEETLATPYGSVSLCRLPRQPFVTRPAARAWAMIYRVAQGAANRACFALARAGVAPDHPSISPHLLAIARRPR